MSLIQAVLVIINSLVCGIAVASHHAAIASLNAFAAGFNLCCLIVRLYGPKELSAS